MQKFDTVSGPAAPLMAANVNTDVIIRIERLSDHARDQLEPYAFEAWRYREDVLLCLFDTDPALAGHTITDLEGNIIRCFQYDPSR